MNRVQRSFGLFRLARWAMARVGWILVVARFGAGFLALAIAQSREVNPPLASASATVISERNDHSDTSDAPILVYVRFRTKSGQIERATIHPFPGNFAKVIHGQKLPIRYNENAPSQAVYDGLGGDVAGLFDAGVFKGPAYIGAAVWFSLAAFLLLAGSSRLIGTMRAALATVATPVHLRTFGGLIQASSIAGTYTIEWRLLQRQPEISGDVRVLGEPVAGRWLIVRLGNGRLVWPSSKAQPMLLASAALRLPVVQSGRIGSVHLLLAGYAQIADLLGSLPVVIRRPPEPEKGWWSPGALRPVVRALVAIHIRRRLAVLSGALLRAALLCDESDSRSRRTLLEASDECQKFAGTLPRRSIVAALLTVAATALSIISPFLLMPHIALTGQFIRYAVPLILAVVIVFGGAVALIMFFQSVHWKRALFNPPLPRSGRPAARPPASANPNWDVYKLERAAFSSVALPEPSEWESRKWVRWLAITICVAGIAIPFASGGSIYVLPFGVTILNGAIVFSVFGICVASISVVEICKWQRRVRTRMFS